MAEPNAVAELEAVGESQPAQTGQLVDYQALAASADKGPELGGGTAAPPAPPPPGPRPRRIFATLEDMMAESPPEDKEHVYVCTQRVDDGVDVVYVKGKNPNDARAIIVDVERVDTRTLYRAANAANDKLRAQVAKSTTEF